MARPMRRTATAWATANWPRCCRSMSRPSRTSRGATKGVRLIGTNLPRVDIPAKVTGGVAYVQDMRLPGMLHARVVRGPSEGTRLKPADIDAVAQDAGGRAGGARRQLHRRAGDAGVAGRQGAAAPAVGRLGPAGRRAAGRRHARGDPSPAVAGSADLRLSRAAGAVGRQDGQGALQPALPDARLDRAILRRGALGE